MKKNVPIRFSTYNIFNWDQSKKQSLDLRDTCKGIDLHHAIDQYIKNNYKDVAQVVRPDPIKETDLNMALIDVIERDENLLIHDRFCIVKD